MWEARLALLRYRPRVIAITGSVGKTSTKDAIAAALAPSFSVRKSEKSYNSDFGVPLTILGLKGAGGSAVLWIKNIILGVWRIFSAQNEPKWLVVEVGAGKPGDIRRFGRLLSPDIAVITRFAEVPVHLEFFASPEALVEEKTELARAVKQGGTLVLGSDDTRVHALKDILFGQKIVQYGQRADAEVRASDYAVQYEREVPVGMRFLVSVGTRSFQMALTGVLGAHFMQPVLAAFSVAEALGLNLEQVQGALQNIQFPPGRMRLIAGLNHSLVIDDSYNSSPVAVEEALATLAPLKTAGQKIAVLGTMAELGHASADAHRQAGRLAARAATRLVVVGDFRDEIQRGAEEAGMKREQIQAFRESREAALALPKMVRQGDIVLVKGSQSARMERVVKALLQEPSRAAELLVRQEREWQKS